MCKWLAELGLGGKENWQTLLGVQTLGGWGGPRSHTSLIDMAQEGRYLNLMWFFIDFYCFEENVLENILPKDIKIWSSSR